MSLQDYGSAGRMDTNDSLRLASLWHSMHAISQQLSPIPGCAGIDLLGSYKPTTSIFTASNLSQVHKLTDSDISVLHLIVLNLSTLLGTLDYTYWTNTVLQVWFNYTVGLWTSKKYLFLIRMSRGSHYIAITQKHMIVCETICLVAFACAGIPSLSLLTITLLLQLDFRILALGYYVAESAKLWDILGSLFSIRMLIVNEDFEASCLFICKIHVVGNVDNRLDCHVAQTHHWFRVICLRYLWCDSILSCPDFGATPRLPWSLFPPMLLSGTAALLLICYGCSRDKIFRCMWNWCTK